MLSYRKTSHTLKPAELEDLNLKKIYHTKASDLTSVLGIIILWRLSRILFYSSKPVVEDIMSQAFAAVPRGATAAGQGGGKFDSRNILRKILQNVGVRRLLDWLQR
ncbi:hypothetical protein E1B28_000133 [Marasmius oreades]|uniref:Uncharacterized protein n=1 Tax=Marasmius oreades TaxID=181124 RepID=A0A9P7V0S0_9AGAR|nr:uncharacterized protein E1B28_000133 [Marasmius oreades]KAG7098164.1 hypothetical protein E1B28_000133 [Marasmius oreades]